MDQYQSHVLKSWPWRDKQAIYLEFNANHGGGHLTERGKVRERAREAMALFQDRYHPKCGLIPPMVRFVEAGLSQMLLMTGLASILSPISSQTEVVLGVVAYFSASYAFAGSVIATVRGAKSIGKVGELVRKHFPESLKDLGYRTV